MQVVHRAPAGLAGFRQAGGVSSPAVSSSGWADPGWAELAQLQYLAISRAQLLGHGCSPDRIRWLVSSGKSQRLYPGVS